jgi:alkylresorcinol/alkylpyrone synthase
VRIASAGVALPEPYFRQAILTEYLAELWGAGPALVRRMAALHANVQVEGRHLAYPLERYAELDTFGRNNEAWIEAATGTLGLLLAMGPGFCSELLLLKW